MKLLLLCCVLFILGCIHYTESKRGGGGRGGGRAKSTGGSGWFWRNGNKKGSSSNRKSNAGAEGEAVPNPKSSSSVGNAKASAPNPEPGFKKETSHVQQSSNTQQRPIGWNVQNGNPNQQGGAWKGGYNQAHQSPVGNQPQGAWGGGHQGYPQQNNYQGFNRGYSGYPQQSGYNPYNGYNSQPGYHGYSGYGGYGGHGGYGGYGGHGGYGGGGGFGGGYGGGMSGGYGGMGGPMGMYGMKKKSSFFSGGTVSNVLAGMFVYHMASNLVGGLFGRSKPYTVYNYYNQPAVKEEIKLPANILTLCEGNATSFCTKGLIPICTTNNTVLCVATMSQASPCGEENALCVNTSIPCTDKSDPVCSNTTITQNKEEAPMSLPCFTNLTMDINLLNETGPNSGDYKYCVTAMAIAGPEYKNCTDDAEKSIDGYRSVLAGDYTWFLTVDKMKRPYTVHNYQHPPGETPKGDIVMPLPILAPCIDNAKTLCAPGLLSMCTNFGEILCLEVLSSVPYCEDLEATCFTSTVPCLENDPLCQNKTEEEVKTDEKGQNVVSVKLPCFANITINTNLPDFDIHQFNGTIPEGTNTSFMYHYHYCITTLGLPGNETDACIIKS